MPKSPETTPHIASRSPGELSLPKKIWYGVGKAVESQSAAAWNDRIIGVINTKIIPKLSEKQLRRLAKHKDLVEAGAKVAGIGISTAEFMAVFMVAELAKRKWRRVTFERHWDRSLNKDRFFVDLRQAYDRAFAPHDRTFAGMAGAIVMLALKVRNNREQRIPATASRGGSHEVRRRELRRIYTSAYMDWQRSLAELYGKPFVETDELDRQARSSFEQWQKLRHPALPYVQSLVGIKPPLWRRLETYWNQNRMPANISEILAGIDAGTSGIRSGTRHVVTLPVKQGPELPGQGNSPGHGEKNPFEVRKAQGYGGNMRGR